MSIAKIDRRHTLVALTAACGFAAAKMPAFGATGKSLRGVMPVVNTPYTDAGEVDWDDLASQMKFYDRCKVQGAVWPEGGSDAALLTKDERMKGMEVIATACRSTKVASVLAVQGANNAEMVEFAQHAESLSPDAMIVQAPPQEQSLDGLHDYFAALGGVTKRPVIILTSPAGVPSLDLILKLAQEFPNFGYIKEETKPIPDHIVADAKARPAIKGIFGAAGGLGWLFEARLGSDGESTALGMYADVTERLWRAYQAGHLAQAADAYSKLLLMMNCETEIPGTGRYILKKRGVFKTMTIRKRGAAGAPPAISTVSLKPEEIAEIDFRFSTLKPYLAV
jgi:1-pyrroline-4-hydroxy-2-carboxylate deaminase